MANYDDVSTRREPGLTMGGAGHGRFGGDWIEPEPEPRDWKKLFLVLGLGTLSWVATYVGMLELIESNMGDLPLVHQIIIGFSVAMLMTMIIWLLDQIFSPIPFTQKAVYVFGYLFLTLISVGFGFGFYWKVLESRGEATRSAESAVSQVQTALHAGSTRLEQLSETLVQLKTVSAQKAIEERERGTSCPNSSPGDGPRRKLRDADAAQFSFAGDFVAGRVDSIRTEMAGLDSELIKINDGAESTIDPKSGNRNEFMRALNRRLDLTVTGFNAFRGDPQLAQIRSELATRAEKVVFPNGSGGTFVCPDPQLQTALRGVVRAIDQLPIMQKPQIAAVEGAEATIEAFRRLAATIQGAMVLELPPSADELRTLQKKAVQSVAGGAQQPGTAVLSEPVGLSKRDYIPLAIAIFVDFCLLLVSIGRPMNRLNGLVPIMKEAERGPMIKILSRFNEIHRDPEIRQNFEVFRHVVFDMHGAYYVAVPLDAPYRPSGRNAQASFGYGSHDAQELQHEAHLLANLFSGFEQQKIFSRVYNPFLSTKAIQKKLWRQGSKFAGCQAFRVYRFRDGAWSDMILQAVMGAAKRAEEEKRIRMVAEAQARAAQPQPVQQPAAEPANKTGDPLQGFDTGLRHAPDSERRGAKRPGANGLNGMSRVHPSVGKVPSNGHGYRVNGASVSPSARTGQTHRDIATEKTERNRRPANDESTLRSAFGRYANGAAAEFSNGFEDHEDLEIAAVPANANTAPRQGKEQPVEPAPSIEEASSAPLDRPDASDTSSDVVIALSDKRQNRIAAADVHFQTSGATALTEIVRADPEMTPDRIDNATEPAPKTQVTLTRETATFEMPVSDTRIATAIAVADGATPLQTSAPLAVASPPPLPAWARPHGQSEDAAEPRSDAGNAAIVEIDGEAMETAPEVIEAEEENPDIRRVEVTADPFAFDIDDDDDETVVTIARRLRPGADQAS